MTAPDPWFLPYEQAEARGARMHTGTTRCMCQDCTMRAFWWGIQTYSKPEESRS